MAEFLALFDVVVAPVIGQLVARLLSSHALLYQFFATPVLLPGFAGASQRKAGVSHLLHAFITHPGQPQFDWLGLWAGDGLHQPQQGFGCSHVGEVVFTIGSGQFQSVTVCHRLAAVLAYDCPLPL